MDEAGWTPEQHERLLEVANAAFTAAARVRSALPIQRGTPDRYNISVPKVIAGRKELTVDVDSVKPVRLACTFKVLSDQLSDMDVVTRLVRQAAHKLGSLESAQIAFGSHPGATTRPKPPPSGSPLSAKGRISALGFAPNREQVARKRSKPPAASDYVDEIRLGIESLNSKSHVGPHALLLPPKLMSDHSQATAHRPLRQTLEDLLGKDYVVLLVPDAAPKPSGLLLSLGAEPADLVEVDPLCIAKVREDDGDLVLRVEERIAVRIFDPTGIVELKS